MTTVHASRLACAVLVALACLAGPATAACDLDRLERFLESRFFSQPAERKINRYADRLYRYYDKRDISRDAALADMQAWEDRWPGRIYKFIRVDGFDETDDRTACRVVFDYKFIAYSDERDALSAGVGRTTLVLAELEYEDRMRIVAEHGTVLCRGLAAFERGRC